MDMVVRFQGGNNAGHTVVVEGEKTVLHLSLIHILAAPRSDPDDRCSRALTAGL